MRKVLLLVLAPVASAALLLGPAALASAGTLDQQQTNPLGGSLGFSGQRLGGQTFTDGLSGVLDQVDLDLRRTTNLPGGTCDGGSGVTVQIRNVSGGLPGDAVLASSSVLATSVPLGTFGFVSFVVPAPPTVTAGTQYALVASAPDASCSSGAVGSPYDLGGATGNPYGGGAMFGKFDNTSAWLQQGDFDADFKTYVAPPPNSSSASPTGQRAAALASCKKRAQKHHWSKKRLKKCKKKARLLPV